MKSMMVFFSGIVLLVLLGCVSTVNNPSTKEQVGLMMGNASVPAQPRLITSSDQGPIQVVTIYATNTSGKWLFPMQDYNDEFMFAGLYSDSFVMLNNSQIRWMNDNESIWLTIYKGNGSGVLFNAIYSDEIDNCGTNGVEILGKNYSVSQFRNGSSFGSDDKWKVSIDGTASCPRRIIIYLDGYIDGLKDNDQISLFRNDNTILLQFTSMTSQPQAMIIATKPHI